MKKILALILAATMIFSLAACGGNDETPSTEPSTTPSTEPVTSTEPTEEPSEEPTETPTETPTEEPTEEPTETPTETPTEEPTEEPTETPTEEPTETPTEEPSVEPSEEPTEEPSVEPSEEPTEEPSVEPSEEPTEEPSDEPSATMSATDFWMSMAEKYVDNTPMMMQLDETMLTDLYGLDMSNIGDFYAAMPMMSAHVNEVLVANVTGDMQAVKDACIARQQALAGGFLYPANVDLVETYQLVECGNWLIFVIHTNAAEIVADFEATYAE